MTATRTRQAILSELFSSIQGEGPLVGVPQVFVRFYGCHRNCSFCDTPETITARHPKGHRPAGFSRERVPGDPAPAQEENPVTGEQLLQHILDLDSPRGRHHSIALTGGEPLVHTPFLEEWLPEARPKGLRFYLETAGDLPKPLARLLPWLDWLALDLKLPSVTGEPTRWEAHRDCLAAGIESSASVFVKAIVSAETDRQDLETAAGLLSPWPSEVTMVLQPLTPVPGSPPPPSPAQCFDWQTHLRHSIPDVRVIPQCHKAMAAR